MLTNAEPVHASLVTHAHRQAAATPFSDIVRFLQELLSRRLTAVIAGVKEGKTIARWAADDGAEVRMVEKEQRLRMAYQIAVLLLSASDSRQTVKAWFIGLNPHLGDLSPAEAIRDDRLKDAWAAAQAFAFGG